MQSASRRVEGEREVSEVEGVVAEALTLEGWMTEAELVWLHGMASFAGSVLEVGTWKGRSTAALASGCEGRVVTVDRFGGPLYETSTYRNAGALETDVFAVATENLSSFPNVEILKMSSADAAEALAGDEFDMVFIDGDHSEEAVREDLALWTPYAVKLLCGHDRGLPGVAAALEGLDVTAGPDSIWWVKV